MKFNRRDFIKTGGMVMLGSIATPSLFGNTTGSAADQATGISLALAHFGVSESDLKKVLTAALEKGGDYADLYFEHTYRNNISLQDGAVNRASSNIDFGMGVRVLAGDQTGYAYVEDVTPEEMLKAARTAARIATGAKGGTPVNLTEVPIPNNYYGIRTPWDEITVNAKTPYLQKLNDKIFALDPRVLKVNASLSDTTSHILFCNSEGQLYYDYRPMVTLGAVCIMQENNQIENSYAARAYRMGYEFLTDELIDTLAQESVDKTSILFQAIKPKGGEMPVVMGAGGSGILLHEAIGHTFEADFNRKNTSIFSDQLNKKICNEHINIVDDGTIPFNRGSVNIDDEGIEGQKTYLVKEGMLTSYLHDRISARHYGIRSTGNGRRESFRHTPIPRMRATYMEAGNVTEEEMISTVKNGIYAANFTNGQVQIGAGDFTF
ncbi:MAG: metallopeptidase TldD-related protein, partial [Tannerellaceae bacterium]|nr:metallopeptidase TldD-related protein [Tannerellaceae bacterium]